MEAIMSSWVDLDDDVLDKADALAKHFGVSRETAIRVAIQFAADHAELINKRRVPDYCRACEAGESCRRHG